MHGEPNQTISESTAATNRSRCPNRPRHEARKAKMKAIGAAIPTRRWHVIYRTR